MSRRDAATTGQQARHVRARLQAALGEAGPGDPKNGLGLDGFEYRGSVEASGPPDGAEATSGTGPALRWRVGLRVALLLAAVAAAACAWFWWQSASAAPDVLPLSGVSSGTTDGKQGRDNLPDGAEEHSAPAGLRPAESGPPGTVVVHVAGAVAKPGVVRLQQGSRVEDAIAAAGGATTEADANRLNLALVVEDGQKIQVPLQGEPLAAPNASESAASGGDGTGSQGAAAGTPGGKVNLNTADVAMLDTLPKVGPVLAQRIIDWRKEHGPFKSVEELDAVDGVGPKMLETLLPLVTV